MYKKQLQNEATDTSPTSPSPGHRCMCLSALLSLSSLVYTFVTDRSVSSIQMPDLYRLPGSPDADTIPFPATIVLSIIVFIGAVIRLGGYFRPRSNQPLQLVLSVISLVASGLLLGFVSSRSRNHWCEIAYVCLLIVNIGVVESYEVSTLNKRQNPYANTLTGGILLANLQGSLPVANTDFPCIRHLEHFA